MDFGSACSMMRTGTHLSSPHDCSIAWIYFSDFKLRPRSKNGRNAVALSHEGDVGEMDGQSRWTPVSAGVTSEGVGSPRSACRCKRCLLAASALAITNRVSCSSHTPSRQRQAQPDFQATTLGVAHLDAATVHLHHALHDRQPQTMAIGP